MYFVICIFLSLTTVSFNVTWHANNIIQWAAPGSGVSLSFHQQAAEQSLFQINYTVPSLWSFATTSVSQRTCLLIHQFAIWSQSAMVINRESKWLLVLHQHLQTAFTTQVTSLQHYWQWQNTKIDRTGTASQRKWHIAILAFSLQLYISHLQYSGSRGQRPGGNSY